MSKLLLLSVLFATVAIPAIGARDPNPRRGLRRVLIAMAGFSVVYFLGTLYVVQRLF